MVQYKVIPLFVREICFLKGGEPYLHSLNISYIECAEQMLKPFLFVQCPSFSGSF